MWRFPKMLRNTIWELCGRGFYLKSPLFVFIFYIKDRALSPFFPQGFRGFTEASLGLEDLQRFLAFAAVGVSQSIQEVGVYQPWPEWECWNSRSCRGWNPDACDRCALVQSQSLSAFLLYQSTNQSMNNLILQQIVGYVAQGNRWCSRGIYIKPWVLPLHFFCWSQDYLLRIVLLDRNSVIRLIRNPSVCQAPTPLLGLVCLW